ncbi:putative nucleotide-diphospho-sugar transferase [Solemya velum gill symbiont]|uniref:Nucleotide-diphospho-sugar transferase domain-containing protein n=1 Tax=Solemya velum gill symbiont TaxID=2340 RepID=A0A1T2FED9_SOVGS|nr:putative nucleotide-diphospho-sugar transferase [Solemya velum gill symbiont]OOY34245.1 hypothetical protein BOV88_11235 [Solemya velum gill symbiont]OOY36911.1 hypothetical protein BOV89_09975 [Solemya velum gill symbiont]OOY39272.1 hypothetical protein BOV90_10220 [Solemya velum gill symbiont]OOY43246.1 hypothetical protein BOV91_04520 [Solemya velum gill symbiont]OOY46728.1 hypothetical protein BOV93_09260 [Solemya velum gill symbiont]
MSVVYLVHGTDLEKMLENSVRTLLRHCENIDVIIYYTDDSNTHYDQVAQKFGVRVIPVEDITGNREYSNFGTENFNRVTSLKWKIILQTLDLGYDTVVFSDCDIAFVQDFRPYIESAVRYYPVGVQSESSSMFPPAFCTGFMYFNKSTKPFLERLKEINQNVLGEYNDQEVFNRTLGNTPKLYRDILTLPESLFPNGLHSRSFVGKDFEGLFGELSPFLFHANFVKGVQAKIDLLKYVNLWEIA